MGFYYGYVFTRRARGRSVGVMQNKESIRGRKAITVLVVLLPTVYTATSDVPVAAEAAFLNVFAMFLS